MGSIPIGSSILFIKNLKRKVEMKEFKKYIDLRKFKDKDIINNTIKVKDNYVYAIEFTKNYKEIEKFISFINEKSNTFKYKSTNLCSSDCIRIESYGGEYIMEYKIIIGLNNYLVFYNDTSDF